MSIPPQKLWELADRLRGQLLCLRIERYGRIIRRSKELTEALERFRRRSELLALCVCRNWLAAAASMTERISLGLRDLPYCSSRLEQAIDAGRRPVPEARQIYDDLQQTSCEFGGLCYYVEDDELAVTTEPIQLEHIHLGPFEIRLRIAGLANMRHSGAVYRIVALDPRPAAGHDHVTHPHVSDQRLCEGEAGAAIHAALQTGRICDFFQLVEAVLTTYNPGSPYVSLDNWEGMSCYDCGYVVSEEDIHYCTSCEADFCPECTSYCRRCNETTCLGCLNPCEVCHDHVCPSCQTSCPECGKRLCLNCRKELQCPCLSERNDEDEQQQRQPEQARQTNAATERPANIGQA